MELPESARIFSVNNSLALNQNSYLNGIQGELLPFNQMIGMKNIAFIDRTIQNYQNLVAGITPNTEIVLLDPTRDGVEQITEILGDRTEISSAHIITHGNEASLQLGTTQLSLANLHQHRASLEQWKNALTVNADIILYGCKVAAGEQGTAFVQSLSEITDADIAASDNLTGNAALGGDWAFEVKTGEIEAKLALEAETMAGYDSVLLSFAPVSNFSTTASQRNLTIGDFNKDGNPDIATAGTHTHQVSTLLGTGTGSFGTATSYSAPLGTNTWAVAVGDFNKDGNSDLVTANNGTSSISLLLGDGTGNFGTANNFNVGSGPYSVAVEDFNKDGNLDLVTANRFSNNVSVLLGDGTGKFSTPTNFSAGSSPSCVVVEDFNKDGNLDLATANESSRNLSILLGDGTGKFGTATNFSTGGSSIAIVANDFNKDGNLDLATANRHSNNISVLFGDGTGKFGTFTNYSVGNETLFIAAGDLDGDGNIDLATADNQSNQVSILLGTATGNFKVATKIAVGTNPQGIVIADLNKDGLLDIATANFGSQNVSVLINSQPLVNFGAATYKATEENSDAIVNIPVTLSATPGTDVIVPIVINNGSTATEGASNDFILSTNSVTFKAGATGNDLTQNIAVTIKPDNIPENDETVVLNVGAITGAAAGITKQTTLTIGANDAIDYAVKAGVANIPEGNSGTTPLTFTVNRSGGIDAASKVDFAISGTAANNSDYKDIGGTSGATATTGTITFAAGETQKTIAMNVVGDAEFEPDETVIVSLLNPVAPGPTPTIFNGSTTTTINNDDIAPQPGTLQFSAANFSVPEGNSGTFVNSTVVTVNRTGGSTGAVSVQVRVNPNNPGTASPIPNLNGNDYNYNAFPITVNFADGDTAAKTVIIPINGDTTVEPDETINLELIPASVTGGATIGNQNTAILTISNDDNAGILQFSAANFSVPEGNSGGFVNATAVTVNRTGGSSGAVSVGVWANPNLGTAAVFSDFSNNFSIVNFADGDTAAKTVVFLINGDTVVEPDETVKWEFLPWSVTGGATIGSQNTATLTIINDEPFDEINAGLPGILWSSTAWGDYDNDGKLDILLTGESPSGKVAKVYRNTGNGFTDINAGLTGVSNSSAAWGDYDNDGKLDILLTGDTGSGSITKVYRNTGSGFIDINAGLIGVLGSSAAWGDYDNDGKLDILLTGLPSGSGIIAKVYRNTGNGFTDINAGLTGSYRSSAAWGDYDNDGKLDILLTGGSSLSSGLTTKVYRNTGNGFTDINAGLPAIDRGSAAWGDYDNDGKLDILLTGDTGGSGFIAKVYRNTGNGFIDINADLTGVSEGSAAWGDYDNDGKLDILLTGNTGSNLITKLYRNTGNGFTDSNIGLPYTRSNLVAWGDYDNDGKLDMVFTDYSSGLVKLYRNKTLTANTPPTTPTGLSSTISGTAVTLNWNPATDAQTPTTGLGYNLRVGTTPGGNDVFAPMSLNTGYRQVPRLGNTNMKTSWQLNNLTPGQTYYWSVQAIDTAWAGSPFATEGSFTVANPTPSTVSITATDAEAAEAANGQTANPGQFTLTRTGNLSTPLTVKYTTSGTATNGIDYNNLSGNIVIPAGQSNVNLPVNVIDDSLREGNEIATLTLVANNGYTIGNTKNASVTIADNETRNPPPRPGSGWAIDGYIAGATVFFDGNKNGVRDNNEPSTTTDNSGAYQLDISPDFDTNNNGKFDPDEGYLVAFGGTDTATGLPLETPLVAPPSASVVTLLTSLVTELIDRGINPNTAESQVKAALSLPSEVDLTNLDPIAATNNNEAGGVEVLAAMVKVQNFITQTKGLIDGALGLPQNVAAGKNDIVQGVVSAIANQIESGVILDFSNPEQLAVIIEASINKAKQLYPTFNPVVNGEFIASSANIIAQVNQHIDKIVTTNSPESIHQQIALVQKVALGEITSDFKASASGTKSINEVIAENTGLALTTQIKTAIIPGVPAVSIINGLPKFDSTLLFDSDFYLAHNKDVADAVANKFFPDAFAHFSQFGWAEGRNPSSMFAIDYLNQNSDVGIAVSQGFFASGFAHFIRHGMAENRPGTSEFNRLETFYLSRNSDVTEAVRRGNLGSGIEHLIKYGMAEGRDPFTLFNSMSETFDPSFYLAGNQDVAEAINRGFFRSAFEHFVWFGFLENRNPNNLFDHTSYLAQNSDVAVAVKEGFFHNGLEHFIKHGMAEGRSVTRILS